MVEFTTAQIASGTVNPIHQFSIADPNLTLSFGMAFDRLGNLWIVQGDLNINPSTGNYSGRILEFSAAQLAALTVVPNPSPAVTLTTIGAVYGIAFDASGNLWASVFPFAGGTIQEFSAAQIGVSGTPTATVIIQGQEFGAVAFASDGTLWYTPEVVFGPSGGLVFGLAPAQLATSGSPAAAYMLQANGPSVLSGQAAIFTSTNEIAFDGNGNLWSVFNGFYFEYAQNILHASPSAPTTGFQAYPSEQQGGNTEILPGYALAFDSANDLIANSTNNTSSASNVLKEYTPVQYAGTSPTPTSARFGSSVPAFDGTHLGNYIVRGPFVP